MRPTRALLGLLAFISLAHAQSINAGGVVNAASYAPGGVAPGSIISIFGTNLSASVSMGTTLPLSTSLGDVAAVTFNGIPAPLYFVGPLQVNAQLPWNVLPDGATSGSANMVLLRQNGSLGVQTVPVLPTAPGIFTVTQNGIGQAVATDNNDGAVAAPSGTILGVTSHPWSLSSGHALVIWCTGLGAVSPTVANGAVPHGKMRYTIAAPVVLIGGVAAQVVSSVLSPQFVGENQIGVMPGPGTPTGGAVPLQIQVNGSTTSDKVTIAIGQ